MFLNAVIQTRINYRFCDYKSQLQYCLTNMICKVELVNAIR